MGGENAFTASAPPSVARLIPAWAGKTFGNVRHRAGEGAHPRVGGENRVKGVAAVQLRGSSPRGRGKRLIPRSRQTWDRLIPAWAGKTSKRTRRSLTFSAHPRVGGENQAAPGDEGPPAGSSPRGRGKHGCRDRSLVGLRLIPAWAGKTTFRRRRCAPRGAHPRVGGENSESAFSTWSSRGSSPRRRGKLGVWMEVREDRRLIPA